MTTTKTHKPRFNHVAMTVSPDLLDPEGREQILAFYSDVFGWEEMPQMSEDRKRLVLMAYEFGQFVFLEAGDVPMQAQPGDHFGMSVHGIDELEQMLARAKAWRERDDRVRVIDNEVEDFGVLKLTSFYVQYLLPMTVEVQHYEWQQAPATEPPNL